MRNLVQRLRLGALLLAIPALMFTESAWGQRMDRTRAARLLRRPHVEAQFIVKFREASRPEADDIAPYAGSGVRELRRLGEGEFHFLETGEGGQEVLAGLSEHPDIAYIEPNYVITVNKTPNDPLFAQQWGLKNATVGNADIAAAAAWDYATGARRSVVAVIDSGVDFNHPDLAGNIWTAPRPFTFSGAAGTVTCPAGTRGVNAIASNCVPLDDNGHGTHCAGIIGANGDNGAGAAGVNWAASILPVKFLNASGSGTLADALRAIDAVVQIKRQLGADGNVRVVSASWGFGGSSQALEAALASLQAADILFVAAAGNKAANNDAVGSYPANSTQPNVLSVGASDKNDVLAAFSNYGTKVHLAAPGVGIVSTYPGNRYALMSGTSMATPFVAGAAALLLSACTANTAAVREHLLASLDVVPGLAGKTATGGRLNVYRAMRRCAAPAATLTATPAARTIVAGTATTYTLLPGGTGGLGGAGTIALTGVPAGVTATLAGPVTLGAAVNVKVTSLATVAAGTYTVTATLTASTYRAATPLTLVVQRAPAFSFTATAPAAAIKTGTSGVVALKITRAAGFTGAVTVKPQGLPAGMTAAPVTIASGQTAGNLTVAVSTAAAGGAAAFTLTATGGVPLTTVSVPVTIPVEKPASLTLTFQAPATSVKAGNAAAMGFTIASTAPPTAMQFTLSGMPGPAEVQIAPVSAGVYKLVIYTPVNWAGRTATLKLALAANGLTSASTATLTVTP